MIQDGLANRKKGRNWLPSKKKKERRKYFRILAWAANSMKRLKTNSMKMLKGNSKKMFKGLVARSKRRTKEEASGNELDEGKRQPERVRRNFASEEHEGGVTISGPRYD